MSQSGDGEESALRVEYEAEIAIINASGDLTGPSKRIESAMMEILNRGYRLVMIDLSEATKIDAEAIADLVVAVKRAFEVEATVVGVRPRVQPFSDPLILDNHHDFIEFFESRDDALAALRGDLDGAPEMLGESRGGAGRFSRLINRSRAERPLVKWAFWISVLGILMALWCSP